MRKIIFFFVLISVFSSCTPVKKRDQFLIGKWNFEKVDAAALESQLSETENERVTMMEKMMQGMSYEFLQDKTFRVQSKTMMGNGGKNGHYALKQDGAAIQLTKENSRKPKTMNIAVLNSDSLVLEENGVKLIFLKAK